MAAGRGPLFEDIRDALSVIAEPRGAWNWVFAASGCGDDHQTDVRVVAGGSGSVPEMGKYFEDHGSKHNVLFGLVRLAFGKGDFRREWHAFVEASNADTSISVRSLSEHQEHRLETKAIFDKHISSCCHIEATCSENLSVENIVERVRQIVISDSIEFGDISVKAFWEALEEEQACRHHEEELEAEEAALCSNCMEVPTFDGEPGLCPGCAARAEPETTKETGTCAMCGAPTPDAKQEYCSQSCKVQATEDNICAELEVDAETRQEVETHVETQAGQFGIMVDEVLDKYRTPPCETAAPPPPSDTVFSLELNAELAPPPTESNPEVDLPPMPTLARSTSRQKDSQLLTKLEDLGHGARAVDIAADIATQAPQAPPQLQGLLLKQGSGIWATFQLGAFWIRDGHLLYYKKVKYIVRDQSFIPEDSARKTWSLLGATVTKFSNAKTRIDIMLSEGGSRVTRSFFTDVNGRTQDQWAQVYGHSRDEWVRALKEHVAYASAAAAYAKAVDTRL